MATLRIIRRALLICTLINYGLLILWFVILSLPHTWIFNPSSFGTTPAEWDRINLTGIVYYKLAIILFNLVPCISLYLVKIPKEES